MISFSTIQELKNPLLKGRYIYNLDIEKVFKSFKTDFNFSIIGNSVLGEPIYSSKFGVGKTKILIWSQMHGNESTTTKGLLDFYTVLDQNKEYRSFIFENYTIYTIPILNPDGAKAYTRVNANQIDLNRDAFDCSQPESIMLRAVYEDFKPDFCYNLHDQRTIFGIKETGLPATMSFLSPAFDASRTINETREKAIHVINKMNRALQTIIPGQIGRFDDSFNINCIGDYFTSRNTPTILFEAGHFENDYLRDRVREFVCYTIVNSFTDTSSQNVKINDYLSIPQNNKFFYDILYKNVTIIENSQKKIITFAAQFEEKLQNNTVVFEAQIVILENASNFKGHIEYDCNNKELKMKNDFLLENGVNATFEVGDDLIFVNGIKQ